MHITVPGTTKIILFFLLAILLLAMPAGVFAQRYLASIAGDVTDSTGAKVPKATVTAEETGTHFKTIGTTNDAGAYSFPALNPGAYILTATATGFRTQTRWAWYLLPDSRRTSTLNFPPALQQRPSMSLQRICC